MNSLPILLIAFALLPVSTAIECHLQIDANGRSYAKKDTQECKYSRYCVKMNGRQDGVTFKGKFCDEPIAELKYPGGTCNREDCVDGVHQGVTVSMCCCKGNLCNPAADPTVLFSLAALAAVIAARI